MVILAVGLSASWPQLAQMAGVGVTGYTWLEQGRDINVSGQVLEAICPALLQGAMDFEGDEAGSMAKSRREFVAAADIRVGGATVPWSWNSLSKRHPRTT
jgi:hypothetical protein